MRTVKTTQLWMFACTVIALFSFLPQDLAAADRPQPPSVFQRLVEKGNVKLDFYDQSVKRTRFAGNANYQMSVRSRFTYEYRIIVRRNVRYVRITPRVQQLKWTLEHTVRLPDRLDGPGLWDDELVKHEFDHVAISTDPRVWMLIKHLIRGLKMIERPLSGFREPSADELQRMIEREHSKRRDAVLAVVQKCYERLDELTDHGNRDLVERDAFFHNLYSKAGLDDAGFPYLGEVLSLLRSRQYRKAALLHHSQPIDDDPQPKTKRKKQTPQRKIRR